MTYIIILILLGVAAFGFRRWSKRRAIKRILATPLTDAQRAMVAVQVPITRRLPQELRGKLEGKIQLFLHQVEFIGCDDLEVTEEMELSIAAQACLLIVNSDSWYKNLRTLLIYPGAFKSVKKEYNGYVVTERETVRLGESWARGPVILSWQHSHGGAANDRDGHNVVLHEFAHQLDDLSGATDGAPILAKGQSFADWRDVFTTAFETHVKNIAHARPTVIDPYGAEGPEEFFAVAVEVFFERPAELSREEPAVYAQLATFFKLDPIAWT